MDEKMVQDVMKSFVSARGQIIPVLVNTRNNPELISKSIPARDFSDLHVVYRVVVDDLQPDYASVLITKEVAEKWKVLPAEIDAVAMKNLRASVIKSDLRTRIDAIAEGRRVRNGEGLDADGRPQSGIMCISNKINRYGAAALLLPEFMDEISRTYDGNFYILPSSIHECLVVDASHGNIESFNEMVQNVNEQEVPEDEQLSDHVYSYDPVRHEIYDPSEAESRNANETSEQVDVVSFSASVQSDTQAPVRRHAR